MSCCNQYQSEIDLVRDELARVTASADEWRVQAVAQARQITRMQQKIDRLKFVRDENDRRAAVEIDQLKAESARFRCMFELMSAAKRYAEGGTADDMRAEIAAAVDALRARETVGGTR